MVKIFVFDPTKKDRLSQFRGGGRIWQILKENLPKETIFTNDLSLIVNHQSSIFINPFFNPFQPPLTLKRIAKTQIQIIFDVIPLKYLQHFPIGLKGRLNLFLNKRALKMYDRIITISQHAKKDITQYLKVPEEKIKVVYPTLTKEFLNPKFEYQNPNDKNSKQKDSGQARMTSFWQAKRVQNLFRASDLGFRAYCLYVGDVNWNKNLVNLAHAIKIANVKCVFVGKAFEQNLQTVQTLNHPWQKEFKDFLTEVGDDKRFTFLGYIPDGQLVHLYQNAKLNILVSRDEGFGFSYLEAASQSCPSVLSDITVFREIAANSALLADPNNPNDIADKIGELYFNNEVRNQLGKKAFARFLKLSGQSLPHFDSIIERSIS